MGGNPYRPRWAWRIQIPKLAGALRRRGIRLVRWERRTGQDPSILGRAPRLV